MATVIERDDQYVLNHCTKFLARTLNEPRHNYGQFGNQDLRATICESWRFPIVDTYSDGQTFDGGYFLNAVTFIYFHPSDVPLPQQVSVVGTFHALYEPIPLRQLRFGDVLMPYWSVTLAIPKGEVHTYRFIVDGEHRLDPVNPQQTTADNGKVWSRFFTHFATTLISFEVWETEILSRLAEHILPFRTKEGQNFLTRYYNQLDRQSKQLQYLAAFRLDQPLNVVNAIDKLLAKEENHHRLDYKICLDILDKILRQRNPFTEPELMSKEMYIDLYDEMADDNVNGWDYNRYQSPRYFLQLLRRHTYTAAFSHPKYGGNVGAACWAYLSETYTDLETKTSLFAWQRALEKPLGQSADYRG
jgi:hypothetical protein